MEAVYFYLSPSMITFPNAKINLGLFITEKLPNGFHNIESCLYPVAWHDVLEFVPAQKSGFSSSGIQIPQGGKEDENLVIKAYKLLKRDFNLPELKVHLHKLIPIGAGLGGGSSDASFMLKMLNQEFQLFLESSILEDYAAQLGSDCPFFIQNKAALVSGTGTTMQHFDFNLQGLWGVLVKPNVHVSTKEAYAGVSPKPCRIDLKTLLLSKDFKLWRKELVNDFEASIFANHPGLESIKTRLYNHGAAYASMSGSGSTLFGLFLEEPQALSFQNSTVKILQF